MTSKKSHSMLGRLSKLPWLRQAAFGLGFGVVIHGILEGISTLYLSDRIESYIGGPTILVLHDSLFIAAIIAIGIYQQKKDRSLRQTAITLCGAILGYILSAMIGMSAYVRLLPLVRYDINYNLLGLYINLLVLALGVYIYHRRKNVYAGLSVIIGIRIILSLVLTALSFLFIAYYYDFSLSKYLNDPDVRFLKDVNRQCGSDNISSEDFTYCVDTKMNGHYRDYCRDTAPKDRVRSNYRCPLPD